MDFYFDFSSPYSYLLATKIDTIAAVYGVPVRWKVHLVGAAFKLTGAKPMVSVAMKKEYADRDLERTAALYGIELRMPERFPFIPVAAARGFVWMQRRSPELARDFAKLAFGGAYIKNYDLQDRALLANLAAQIGVDREEFLEAQKDQGVKEGLRAEVNAALDAGIFGVPTVVVEDERFWGFDKHHDLERWLSREGGLFS